MFRGVNFSGWAKLAPYLPVAPPLNIVFKFPFPEIKMPTKEELRLELQKVATDLDRLKALGFNVVMVPLISWWKSKIANMSLAYRASIISLTSKRYFSPLGRSLSATGLGLGSIVFHDMLS